MSSKAMEGRTARCDPDSLEPESFPNLIYGSISLSVYRANRIKQFGLEYGAAQPGKLHSNLPYLFSSRNVFTEELKQNREDFPVGIG